MEAKRAKPEGLTNVSFDLTGTVSEDPPDPAAEIAPQEPPEKNASKQDAAATPTAKKQKESKERDRAATKIQAMTR